MTLQDLQLRPTLLKALEKKARHTGQTPSDYVRSLVERDLLADRPFDRILAPVRASARAAGLHEADVDALVREVRRGQGQGRRRRG